MTAIYLSRSATGRNRRLGTWRKKLDNHLGKTIRITPDGAPAPGSPFIGKAGALPEIWSYDHRSELFPQWKNSVFVGALGVQMLDRLTLSGKKVVAEEPLLMDRRTRIRDVRIGPEGVVYVLTDGGTLMKVTPR